MQYINSSFELLSIKFKQIFTNFCNFVCRLANCYWRNFPDRKKGSNCGYALLSLEGVIQSEGGIFSQHKQRSDIFQLQMYYYAARQATNISSLEGLRVLDVSCGQEEPLKFLGRYFKPRTVVGYDYVKRQLKTKSGITSVTDQIGKSDSHINLA